MKNILLKLKDKLKNLGTTNIDYWAINNPELRFYLSITGLLNLDDEEKQQDYKEYYFAMDLLVPIESFINACQNSNINLTKKWFNRYTISALADKFVVNFPLMLARIYDFYNKVYSSELTKLLNFDFTLDDLKGNLYDILYNYNQNYEYTIKRVMK